jgi:glutathione reductase (NADPH)
MTHYDFDLFVIGGGSGGVRAGRVAATHGARVAVAEERYMGGTCVNVGCVPKKLLAYAAGFGHGFEDSAGYGWNCTADSFSWSDLIRNKDAEILRLNGIYRRILDQAGVKIFDARATLAGPREIAIAGHGVVSAERILIATGGWPKFPDIPGKELAITSNEVFHLEALPRRILIVGGGYIAVEFAGIFSGLGVEVTLVHRGMAILTAFDHELGEGLMREMHAQGIKAHLHTVVKRLERTESGLRAICNEDSAFEVDCVLYATGRSPATAGMGLAENGVVLDGEGAVVVDDEDRTSAPHIFAIGDVTNRLNLTPVATAKGHALADRLFAGRNRPANFAAVPTAIFSSPPIATVGVSEDEAIERGIAFDVYKQSFRPLKHRLSMRDQQTSMKLIVDRATDRVLGCHMIGDDAAEIMQGFAVALTAGATKAMFDQTIGIHPTSAEEFLTMRAPVPRQRSEAAERPAAE